MKTPRCRYHACRMKAHEERTPFAEGNPGLHRPMRIIWRCPIYLPSGLQCAWVAQGEHEYIHTWGQRREIEADGWLKGL